MGVFLPCCALLGLSSEDRLLLSCSVSCNAVLGYCSSPCYLSVSSFHANSCTLRTALGPWLDGSSLTASSALGRPSLPPSLSTFQSNSSLLPLSPHLISPHLPSPPLFPPVWLQVGLPDKPRFSSVPMTHQWLRDNEAALNNAFEVFSEAYQVLQQVRGEGKMG